jgi:tetratricopeptide (TPR) repeat protein
MASCQACNATTQSNGKDLLECAGGCNIFYCSKTCQEKDWKSHKLECKAFQSHTCWICQKSGQKGDPVYRSCGCRGDKGFGHLHCFVDYAKGRPSAYKSCHMCKEYYQNETQRVLAKQMNEVATTIDEELWAKNALACSYLESGNTEASYKCFKEIVETGLRLNGEDHALKPSVSALAVLNLTGVAIRRWQWEEAVGWLSCLERGIQNGTIAPSLVEFGMAHCFAAIYTNLGQVERALPFAECCVQLYERYEQVGGDAQKKLLMAKCDVGQIYCELGQYGKAATIYKEMYKEAKNTMGSSHLTTKLAKKTLAELEFKTGKYPSDVQASAVRSRRIAIGFLHGMIGNRQVLDRIPVEIRLFSREKGCYLVQMTAGDRSKLYVKPSCVILHTDTPVHVQGLQNAKEYNGRGGRTCGYSAKSGRHIVTLEDTKKLITVKPENLLAQYQPDLVFDTTRTLVQMLSDPNACF